VASVTTPHSFWKPAWSTSCIFYLSLWENDPSSRLIWHGNGIFHLFIYLFFLIMMHFRVKWKIKQGMHWNGPMLESTRHFLKEVHGVCSSQSDQLLAFYFQFTEMVMAKIAKSRLQNVSQQTIGWAISTGGLDVVCSIKENDPFSPLWILFSPWLSIWAFDVPHSKNSHYAATVRTDLDSP